MPKIIEIFLNCVTVFLSFIYCYTLHISFFLLLWVHFNYTQKKDGHRYVMS